MANYIDAKALKSELKKSQEDGQPTTELLDMFMMLVHRVPCSYATEYVDVDDLHQVALLALLKAIPKIDMSRAPSSMFAYLTTVCVNSFRHQWREECTYRSLKASYANLKRSNGDLQ